MKIPVNISEEEKKILEKRAKKNMLSLREQIEDIIRRSCVSGKTSLVYKKVNPDDRLIHIFSREVRGRKKKK